MRRRTLATIVVVPLLLSASGCAGTSGDLSASAAKVLKPAVQDVRVAAASGTYSDLRQAVRHLKDLVDQEQQAGELSSQRAVAIENAADVLLQDARPTPSPTPSLTSESPTPTPTPTTTSESPTPTPTTTSPSASPTSASPTPSESKSPLVSVSGNAHKPHKSPSPTPTSNR